MESAATDWEDAKSSRIGISECVSNTSIPEHGSLLNPAVCVICLDRILEEAVALPCKHDQFHFSCLSTWLQQNRACPLCKREVKGIEYREDGGHQKVYYLADETSKKCLPHRQRRILRRRTDSQSRGSDTLHNAALAFRKRVYDQRLYSAYIGANAYSKHRRLTPEIIKNDDRLVAKAKKWIRRELAVFEFLNPDSSTFGRTDRRATNAEFLLEYIIAILRSIDVKGSAGQAQELLGDFLGRESAKLFLHELEAWLRSPFEVLQEWDRAAQYPVLRGLNCRSER